MSRKVCLSLALLLLLCLLGANFNGQLVISASSSTATASNVSQLSAASYLEQDIGSRLVQLALISARGPLAFWRPDELSKNGPESSGFFPTKVRLGAANQRCLKSQQTPPPTVAANSELVAIEGSTLRLAFVILTSGNKGAGSSGNSQVNQGEEFTLRWTHNRETTITATAAAVGISSTSQQQRIKITQQPIKVSSNSAASETNIAATNSNGITSSDLFATNSSSRSLESDANAFLLAPYLDERQVTKLAAQQQEQQVNSGSGLKSLLTKWSSTGRVGSNQQNVVVVDDFLADGQVVDQVKLNTYLEMNANSLKLVENCISSSSNNQQRNNHHQLHHLLLEWLQPLTPEDAGAHQLEACVSGGRSNECATANFLLQVPLNMPKLEQISAQQQQIYEPGDRMSIKCVASGFTLPQVTWFLDGVQLSEQQQQQDEDTSLESSHLISSSYRHSSHHLVVHNQHHQQQQQSQRLRVGDYVSQDGQVHSFVNISHLQLTDGGSYKCQANNGFHTVEHEVRVNVRGPPTIARHLANRSGLAAAAAANSAATVGGTAGTGANPPPLQVQCPYSGYPIAAIEWYFRPELSAAADNTPLIEESGNFPSRQLRAKRQRVGSSAAALTADQTSLDSDRDPDADRDEWLSQATALTASPPSAEDYPEPLPDWLMFQQQRDSSSSSNQASDDYSASDSSGQLLFPADYEPVGGGGGQLSRRKRQTTTDWIKFPQSRRHQVHSNGTLMIHELSRADAGFYKCRAIGPQLQIDPQSVYHAHRSGDEAGQSGPPPPPLSATSNEFHLGVLVMPVISPFSSSESLRQGMRNFLTCSVIEGDSPVRLRWFKESLPIEEYIAQQQANNFQQQQQQQQQRIRVEASNEYTSTLYFSHVDYQDNGNYTCMATNKAASVNYTARMLVNVPPKWISAPKDLECVAGQSIVIDCQAEAHPAPRVWWEIGVYTSESSQLQQSSKDILLANKSPGVTSHLHHHYAPNHYRTIISNSRIHILENASLVIRDVHRQDQGYYLCQAANNFGSLSSLIKLTVNVGASFASKYLIKYVKLNERVELDCDPNGQAPVDVIWYMRRSSTTSITANNQLNHTTSLVTQQQAQVHMNNLSSPTTNQSSAHQDSASLGRRLFIGTIRTELPTLAPSTPQTSSAAATLPQLANSPEQQQQQSSGSFASSPNSEQMKHDQVAADLDSSMSFELIQHQRNAEMIRLVIKAAQRSHSADYVCQASNRYGSEEKLIKLQVQETPDPVLEISAVQVDSRSISIVWLPPQHNGNSPILSYSIDYAPVQITSSSNNHQLLGKWSHLISQQTSAFISSLQPLTSYEIRIRARNQLGQSQIPIAVPPTIITTGEEAPTAPPSDIRSLALSSSSIQLSWLPPAQVQQQVNSVAAGVDVMQIEQQQPLVQRFSVKGYYLGYRIAGSNESFVFKTVSLQSQDGVSGTGITSTGSTTYDLMAVPTGIAHSVEQRQIIPKMNNSINETVASQQPGRLKVTIDELRRSTRYAIFVQAFNSAGPGPQSDIVEVRTLANDPPPAPMIRVGLLTFASIELQWSFVGQDQSLKYHPTSIDIAAGTGSNNNNGPAVATLSTETSNQETSHSPETFVDGYHLYFRPLEGQWQERRLTGETHSLVATGRNELSIVALDKQTGAGTWQRHNASASKNFRYLLDQLACGNSYQIYLVAYNSIGAGLPSQILRTKTRGSAPIAPRKQDYLTPNSTYLTINLDAWMDGGCSVTNFEIRYKQLIQNPREVSSAISSSNSNHWLLLSNQLNPSQRLIELRDLQPETWYAVQTSAESAAGKTQVQHTLMTLDKYGQLPPEAVEVTVNGGNLPALFRSNSSIVRSIFHHLSSTLGGGHLSPLFLSILICLVMFTTCSLLFMRKYTSMMKASSSIDSSTTHTARTASLAHYGSSHHQHHLHHHHLSSSGIDSDHHHSGKLLSCDGTGEIGNDSHLVHEEYSTMKASPCKTSSTTCMTGSSTTSNSAVQGSLTLRANQGNLYGAAGNIQTGIGQENHQCSNLCDELPAMAKFATLNSQLTDNIDHHHQVMSQQSQQLSNQRFRTMPHRPNSTFIAPTANQQIANSRYVCNEQRLQGDFQQHLNDQAIYSKLRLIYNSGSNYNLCNEESKTMTNELGNSNQNYNTAEIINLAVMAQQQQQQQQNQKLLTCKRANHTQNIYSANGFQGAVAQLPPDLSPGELTTLLLECQQQQQQQDQLFDQSIVNSNYGQYQIEPQQQSVVVVSEPTGFTSNYGAASIASGSTSTTNSTQPTTSSSSLPLTNSNLNGATANDQLINLTNGNNSSCSNNSNSGGQVANSIDQHPTIANSSNSQCLKTSLKVNGTGQQPQSNEQNDYALPFPPKWV